MSIVSQIERIANNVSNAYSAISYAGGTLPENRNTDNLEAAIRTIPFEAKYVAYIVDNVLTVDYTYVAYIVDNVLIVDRT